jgi:hypothetical protein
MSTARLTITDGTSIAAYWKATNTNSATRDWTIITNNQNFGDFAIRQGNSQGADATTGTDRLFISNNGLIGIGYSNPQAFLDSSGYGNLVVGNGSGAKGITIFGGTTGQSGLMFADATSGSGAYTGYILYSHSSDQMELATGGGTPRLTISSTGAATFSSSVTASSLTSTGDLFLTTTGAVVFNSAANFNTQIYHSSGSLVFYTGASERARITSGGNVLIGTTTDTGYMLRVTGYANIGGNLVVNGDATITNSLTLSNPTTYTGKYTSDAVTVTGGAAGGGGGTIIIGDSNYVGLLIVSISTQNCVGIFLISSSSQVLLVSQTTTETRFSTTAGALNTANIYFSGSNLILENNIQATRNFRMNFIGKIA